MYVCMYVNVLLQDASLFKENKEQAWVLGMFVAIRALKLLTQEISGFVYTKEP